MSNTNCLTGLACPKCGFDEHFQIAVTGFTLVTDEGFERVEDADWDDNSAIFCTECGHFGIVRDFYAPAPAGDTQ